MNSKAWYTSKEIAVCVGAILWAAYKHLYIDKEGILQFDETTAVAIVAAANGVLRAFFTKQALHFFAPKDGQ